MSPSTSSLLATPAAAVDMSHCTTVDVEAADLVKKLFLNMASPYSKLIAGCVVAILGLTGLEFGFVRTDRSGDHFLLL